MKHKHKRGLSWAAATAMAICFICAAPAMALAGDMVQMPSFADLAEKVSPAVVNIRIVKTVKGRQMMGLFQRGPGGGEGGGDDDQTQRNNPFPEDLFERFFRGPGQGGQGQPREFKESSLGSGVIIEGGGYVLTNNHVIADADEIVVRLKGEKELPAKIIGRDAKTDLALIKLENGQPLPALTLGDSDKLRVGDWVLAVGNPFGLEHTVTAGIISAKGRIIGAGPYDDFLQTDASINPGNSGGPLINMAGEVVGINTAIAAQGQGIGFAIPVNMVKKIVEQLRTKGRVVRGYLGIYFQPMTPELAKQFGLEHSGGALVAEVVPGGPAAKAGLKNGDIIIQFADKPITNWHDLPALVADTPVGRAVEVTVIRDGAKKALSVSVGELKDGEAQAAPPAKETEDKLGLSVQALTPELAKQLGLRGSEGVVVTAVREGGPAFEAGLRKGDVVVEVNRKKLSDPSQLAKLADDLDSGEGMLVFYQREGRSHYTVIKAPKE